MAYSNLIDFPAGALAYREYDAVLSDGSAVSLAITLGDFAGESEAVRFAHAHNALAFGLVSLFDLESLSESPSDIRLVWLVDATALSLASEGGAPIPPELQDLVELHLGLFFAQVAPLAPQLAGLHVGPPPPANDNRQPDGG